MPAHNLIQNQSWNYNCVILLLRFINDSQVGSERLVVYKAFITC